MAELMHGVNGLHGGGPWRVLAECESHVHNSVRAAIGRGVNYQARPACICPRSLDLLEQYRQKRKERRPMEHKREKRTARQKNLTRLSPITAGEIEARTPNFIHGLCARPENLKIADMGMNDQASHRGNFERQVAKDLCAECPMLRVCRAWVSEQEQPAGSWGGVWGGMDPWNRQGLTLIIRDGRAAVIPYVEVR